MVCLLSICGQLYIAKARGSGCRFAIRNGISLPRLWHKSGFAKAAIRATVAIIPSRQMRSRKGHTYTFCIPCLPSPLLFLLFFHTILVFLQTRPNAAFCIWLITLSLMCISIEYACNGKCANILLPLPPPHQKIRDKCSRFSTFCKKQNVVKNMVWSD
jgi:hypothetical protein